MRSHKFITTCLLYIPINTPDGTILHLLLTISAQNANIAIGFDFHLKVDIIYIRLINFYKIGISFLVSRGLLINSFFGSKSDY